MKLSIIIPTYNSAAVLGRALDSIVSQTFNNWEVLVMDGASKDATVSIAQSYQDSRIKVFSEPDRGIYDAMNKGIDKAKGEWLYFLGSDDWLYNINSLDKIFQYDDIYNYDVVYGTVDAPHLEDKYKGEWTVDNYMDNRCHQAIFYKRSFFGKSLRYNIKYSVCADSAINLRWFLSSRYTCHYYPIVVAHYSAGGFSDQTKDEVYNKDQAGIILRYGHNVLPISERKKMAWWYMIENPEKKIINNLLKIYTIFLRIKAKCK